MLNTAMNNNNPNPNYYNLSGFSSNQGYINQSPYIGKNLQLILKIKLNIFMKND